MIRKFLKSLFSVICLCAIFLPHPDVVEVEVLAVNVIVLDFLNAVLHICVIGWLNRQRLELGGLGNAAPTHAERPALVEQRRVVLLLVHHGVETEDGCKVVEELTTLLLSQVFTH